MLIRHTGADVSSSPRLARTERLTTGSRKRKPILRSERLGSQKENDASRMEEADVQRGKR